MKKMQYIAGIGMSLFIVGCMQSPSIDKKKMQTVKLADGKSYSVPVGAIYTKAPVTPQAIQFYKVMGVSECKDGDITWEDPVVANRINKIMRSGTKQEGITLYVNAAKNEQIGCASPIK